MGERGPVPKRESQRRRRNKPEGGEVTTAPGASTVEAPKANSQWHPVAKRWFSSLAESGQAAFYQPSDWAAAYVLAESLSRDLKPQPIGTTEDGQPIMASLPLKGASLAAYLKGWSSLLVTEGDRRRMRMELELPKANGGGGGEAGDVSWIDAARRRRSGAG